MFSQGSAFYRNLLCYTNAFVVCEIKKILTYILSSLSVALERCAVALEFVRVRQHSPGGAAFRPDLDAGYRAVQRVSLRFTNLFTRLVQFSLL